LFKVPALLVKNDIKFVNSELLSVVLAASFTTRYKFTFSFKVIL